MSLEGQYANREKEQTTEEVIPNFRVDLFEFLDERKRKLENDEHDKDDSSQELNDFIAAERSSNTVKKTKYEWKKFEAFCQQQVNGNLNIMDIPAAALDKLLGKFFKDVRKQNGDEYEPDSISSFQRSVQRHLKELKLPFNILQDEDFVVPSEKVS